MSSIRVSAVEYLNARPLVHGLEQQSELFDLQLDIPARCAAHLHDRSVDLGLIPSIEYLQGADYRIVPDVAVASEGDVASVALFTTRPATSLRSIAVDSSSRTASALLRILCSEWWDIDPKLVKLRPDLPVMLKRCDAALVIGGGVAGIQAALDLADAGHKVYLVEKKPSIGGIMAQLDKVYPDIECSI